MDLICFPTKKTSTKGKKCWHQDTQTNFRMFSHFQIFRKKMWWNSKSEINNQFIQFELYRKIREKSFLTTKVIYCNFFNFILIAIKQFSQRNHKYFIEHLNWFWFIFILSEQLTQQTLSKEESENVLKSYIMNFVKEVSPFLFKTNIVLLFFEKLWLVEDFENKDTFFFLCFSIEIMFEEFLNFSFILFWYFCF